ncbi:MAG: hypothetical protein KIH69_013470 [Anaerolineae bacterium]|nr:hypothetical protein [Anaerolineae bacterium]
MMVQTISVTLPDATLRKLQRVAEVSYRSVDELLASIIDTTFVTLPNIADDIAGEIAAMRLFSDSALWAAAQSSLSMAQQTRLAQLNQFAGERKLAKAESIEQQALLDQYRRAVLRRGQALALLKQRGHAIQPANLTPMDSELSDGDNDA